MQSSLRLQASRGHAAPVAAPREDTQLSASLLATALGGLAIAAFVCDGLGRVRALTAEAEAVLQRGILQVRRERLTAAGSGAAALDAAIAQARSGLQTPGGTARTSVVLRREDALEVLDIVALPSPPEAFGVEPRLLVVARGAGRRDDVSQAMIQTAFGLTPAESAIALQVAEGESTEDIAADRNITVGTLRSHIKSVFCKIGVNRRAELVARLRAFR
jgi:DNA-binding CsgD family transcriptional regulator